MKDGKEIADFLDSVPLEEGALAGAISKLKSVANPTIYHGFTLLSERNNPQSRAKSQQLAGLAVITGILTPQQGSEIIDRAFSDPDPLVQKWAKKAVELVRRRGDDGAKSLFIRFALEGKDGLLSSKSLLESLSRDRNPVSIATTIRKLGSFGDPKLLSRIVVHLDSKDPAIRIAAIEAISQINDGNSLKHIIPLSADKDKKVRLMVSRAIRSFNRSMVLTNLAQALDSPDNAMVKGAIELLSEDGSERAVEILEKRSLQNNPMAVDLAILFAIFRHKGIFGYMGDHGLAVFSANRTFFYLGGLGMAGALLILLAISIHYQGKGDDFQKKSYKSAWQANIISESAPEIQPAKKIGGKMEKRLDTVAKKYGIPMAGSQPFAENRGFFQDAYDYISPYPLYDRLIAQVDHLVYLGNISEAIKILRDFIQNGAGGYDSDIIMLCYWKLADLYDLSGDDKAKNQIYQHIAKELDGPEPEEDSRMVGLKERIKSIMDGDNKEFGAISSLMGLGFSDKSNEELGTAFEKAMKENDFEEGNKMVESMVSNMGLGESAFKMPENYEQSMDIEGISKFMKALEEYE